MTHTLYVYKSDEIFKITDEPIEDEKYKFITEISVFNNFESIYIYNCCDTSSGYDHIIFSMQIFDSISKNKSFQFKNKSLSLLYCDLIRKAVLIKNDISNDCLANEIYVLLNTINRYSNYFFGKYQSLIDEMNNEDISFKGLPKNANY